MFQHFIVTPFNVDLGLKPREELFLLDKDCITRRFKLFKEFCFESVYHQTNQNFKWLVFFDYELPDDIKEQIKILQKWPNFIPIFTPDNTNFQPFLVEVIRQYLTPDDTHIITTWLDGDDAIADHFIEQVQQQFNHQSFEYINFFYGYQLTQEGLFLKKYLSSPFISLIEQIENNILTCKVMSHSAVYRLHKKGLPVRQVFESPLWIQLIHEDNICSKMHYSTPIPQSLMRLKQNFSIQSFVVDFSQNTYSINIKNYLNYLFTQIYKYKKITPTLLGNLLLLIHPNLLQIYHRRTVQKSSFPSKSNQLSLSAIKALCLQEKTGWRKSEET